MPKKRDTLLGEGSFGCVVQPRLPCPTKEVPFPSSMKAVPRKKQVSKIFTNDSDFSMEMRKSAMAAKADPTGKNLLLPTSSCVTTKKFVDDHSSAIKQCDVMMESLFQQSKKLYQMNMPYGGKRVDKFIKEEGRHKTRREFLQDLVPAFEGLLQLAREGICHQDIKPSNMLYTPQNQIILIDYSLMLPLEDIYTEQNLRVLKHSYLPYPPEFKMFALFFKNACTNACPYYKEVYENFTSFGGDRYDSFLHFHSEEEIQKELTTLYKWTVQQYKNNRLMEAYRIWSHKIDTYSLGMCMATLDKWLVDGIGSQNDNDNKDKKFHKEYTKLVQDMTHIHPRKRLDAEQAWTRVQKILKMK